MVLPEKEAHPTGEAKSPPKKVLQEAISVETFAGKVHVEWDPTAAVTPMGSSLFS